MFVGEAPYHRQQPSLMPREGVVLPPLATAETDTLACTFEAGLKIAETKRWRGKRSYASSVSSVRKIIAWLHEYGVHEFSQLDEECVADLMDALNGYYKSSSVARYVACFRVVCAEAVKAGLWKPTFDIEQPGVMPEHKWYLDEETMTRLVTWARPQEFMEDMADLILWIFLTGVRVEEALRLRVKHLSLGAKPRVKVPGTKNASSVRMIPLSTPAAALAKMLADRAGEDGEAPLFRLNYENYKRRWHLCRAFLGEEDEPTCTLKGLRRSFAASMVDREMPVEMISHILGHADIATTMGYLKLIGNFLGERARKWMD